MRNILTSSLELDNFKIATIQASVSDTDHASVTMPTIARWYRKWDTVTLLSGWDILIKTASGDILWGITISLDTWASISAVSFNAVSSMVAYTEYPLTEDINYIDYGISYTPPTKRLLLYVTTDWLPSIDWMWKGDNFEDISYVDMPVDYSWIFLTSAGSSDWVFTPADSSRNLDSSLEFTALSSPRQWIVFKWIKYIPSVWTEFDVDLSTPYHEAIPYAKTWGLLRDWDKMIMVFESKWSWWCASTYTKTSIQNWATILSAVQTYLTTTLSANSVSITMPGSLNYVALWDDNNYYFFVNVDWMDSSWTWYQWCVAIKCSSTGTDIEYWRAQDQESSGWRWQVDSIFKNGDEWGLSSMWYSSWQDMWEWICSYISA